MQVIKEILSALHEKVGKEGNAVILGNKQIALDESKIKEIQEDNEDVLVGFVDGGNAEILKGANFSVQFIRVFATLYKGLEKIHTFKQEFFVMMHAVVSGNDVSYEVVPFETKDKFFKVDAKDGDLTSHNVRLSVGAVGNIVRKVSELRLARVVAEQMKKGILVLDGDLEIKNSYERGDYEKLLKTCGEDISLVGLSKTTQLLTNTGDSVVAVLAKLGKGRWYHDANHSVSFVKLHERGEYIFRMDVSNFRSIGKAAGVLARYAKDPVFLGYPYGLVEADRFARVSNEEKEYLKTRFLAESGDLQRYLHAQDAHSVLDSVG